MQTAIKTRVAKLEANASLRGNDEYDRWLATRSLEQLESDCLRSEVAAELKEGIDGADPANKEIIVRLNEQWQPPLPASYLKRYAGMTERENRAELEAAKYRMNAFASPEQLERESALRDKWRAWYLRGVLPDKTD